MKKGHWIVLTGLLAVFGLLVIGCSAPSKEKELNERDLVLAGVRLGSTMEDVKRTIGEPTRTLSEGGEATWFYEEKRLQVTFVEEKVLSLYLKMGKSPRGLNIGDSLDMAKRLYGDPNNSHPHYNSYSWLDYDLNVGIAVTTDSENRVINIFLGPADLQGE